MTKRPLYRRVGDAFRLGFLAYQRPLHVAPRRDAYSGAGMNRLLLDWTPSNRSADAEIKGELKRLRGRARELARNNSYIRRYLRLLVSNVLGFAGIRLQAVVRGVNDELDVETNKKIEAAWSEWASGPVSVDARQTLRSFEDLILRTLAVDGEVLVRFWRGSDVNRFGLAVQAIDADLLDERFNRTASRTRNEIRLGVEVDKTGRPVGYHVWDKSSTAALVAPRERHFIRAEDCVHLYRSDRVNQTRGVTWLHSIMVAAHMLDGYEESEAVNSRVSSSKMGFFVKTDPAIGSSVSTEGDGGTTPVKMQAAPGTFEILDDGYDFKQWDPSHPTSQFAPFVTQMIRKIASGVSVFANVLANDASGVNYSSFRSFALIERDDWRQIQSDFIETWRRPLYKEWIALALLTGALRLGSRNPAGYMSVRHRPRGWSWIDPEKEAKGAVLAIDNQLTSRTSVLAEKGLNIEDVFAEIKAETRLAADYGIELKTTVPVEEPATQADLEELAGDDRGNGTEPVTGFSSGRSERPRVS